MAYDNISLCAAEALRRIRQVKINGIIPALPCSMRVSQQYGKRI
jgi:hypothetical protein